MKEIRSDKKIFLNIARHLQQMYSDYDFMQKFFYSLIVDKKNKIIKLKIKRKIYND